MIWTKLSYGNLVLPVLLAIALLTLAMLQIVWIKDLSEGQRERMKQNVEIGAARFAGELAEILESIHAEYQFMDVRDETAASIAARVYRIWSNWKNLADYPDLVQSIYVIQQADQDTHLISRIGDGSDAPISDEERQQVIAMLGSTATSSGFDVVPNLSTVFGDESMLVVNVVNPDVFMKNRELRITTSSVAQDLSQVHPSNITSIRSTSPSSAIALSTAEPSLHLVVAIDSTYLKQTVIPSLTEKHLMYDGSLDYNIVIAQAGNGDTDIYYGAIEQQSELSQSDAVIPVNKQRDARFFVIRSASNILFQNRNDTTLELVAKTQKPISINAEFQMENAQDSTLEQQPAAPTTRVELRPDTADGWNLYVRHNLGSIDAAANRFRRNTSLLSLGMLSILGIGFVLIFRNNAKANELARQQMEFVAGVSHELRTPLSVIRSASDNMTAGLITDLEGARRYGKLIHSESVRLNDLIEQVLEFSGIQSGQRNYEYKPEQPHRLVLTSMKGLGERVDPEHVSINISFDPCPYIMADSSGLISVIQNLVINAIKYNGENPIVDIRVYNAFEGGKQRVCIDIKDNGQGIDQDELDKIFEPFYRASGIRDQQIKGNGLGLSIVKSIMQQHDGSISVSSNLGIGSTFTLTFNWLDLKTTNS
jgi:signal transduction histidine kinase